MTVFFFSKWGIVRDQFPDFYEVYSSIFFSFFCSLANFSSPWWKMAGYVDRTGLPLQNAVMISTFFATFPLSKSDSIPWLNYSPLIAFLPLNGFSLICLGIISGALFKTFGFFDELFSIVLFLKNCFSTTAGGDKVYFDLFFLNFMSMVSAL